ncbi:MAG: hypothetical protein H7Y30_05450 [Pyrinomonadaceae bacterium]|nr:hypothetical protein [Pyrinomonadaceae bacterium]
MAKKQTTKKRTQVKDLPPKEKKLSERDMKKIKGGFEPIEVVTVKIPKPGKVK